MASERRDVLDSREAVLKGPVKTQVLRCWWQRDESTIEALPASGDAKGLRSPRA
jgi:hypothetical protein